MLTESATYRFNVDYAGEYERGGKLLPVLALRIYIGSDKLDPNKKLGVNINSEGTGDYAHAVETISGKIDRWFKRKYNEDMDSRGWLMNNKQMRCGFERLSRCSSRSVRSLRTKEIIA